MTTAGEAVHRECAQCGVSQQRAAFSAAQWRQGAAGALRCKACAAGTEGPRRRKCFQCGADATRDAFSANQWRRSAEEGSTCMSCLAATDRPTGRRCIGCGREKPRCDFSANQWATSAQDGSRCRPCATARVALSAPRSPQYATEDGPAEKRCTDCGRLGNEGAFSRTQWGRKVGGPRKCSRCASAPVPGAEKRCSACGHLGKQGDFPLKEWRKEGPVPRKCNLCCLPPASHAAKKCAVCGQEMGEDAFSATQWRRGVRGPRKCRQCAPPPVQEQKECAVCGKLGNEVSFSLQQWAKKSRESRTCNLCTLLPALEARKECTVCKQFLAHSSFSLEQWNEKQHAEVRKASRCAPPALAPPTTRECAVRGDSGGRDDFRQTQCPKGLNGKGTRSKCAAAPNPPASADPPITKTCTECGAAKPRRAFTAWQWAKSACGKRLCASCTAGNGSNNQVSYDVLLPTKQEAMRYILQTASDVDLPSTHAASFRAVSTVSGQRPKGFAPDNESGFTPREKGRLLRTIHETELCRAGSHKGVVDILRALDKSWKHADMDARFTVYRCDRCCRASARGAAEAPVGNLPKPLHSGQCVGVDLKTITPDDSSPKWVMLLLVDFTSGKVFGWDLDFRAATLEVVQGRIANDFMVNNDPP